MTNYFSPGPSNQFIPSSRFPINSNFINGSDYPDVSTLSISLANACLSPPYSTTDHIHKTSQFKTATTSFPMTQNFSRLQSNVCNNNPWIYRNVPTNQLTDSFIGSSNPVETKLRSISQEELIKTAFLNNRFSGRSNEKSDYLSSTKSNFFSNRMFSVPRQQLDVNMYSGLSTSPSSIINGPSRHLSGDGENHLAFHESSHATLSNKIPLRSIYSTIDHDHNNNSNQLHNFSGDSTWLVNPPAPGGAGDHLRTGRVHEIKSKLIPDRAASNSYMDQALRQVLRKKMKASLVSETEISKFPTTLGSYTLVTPLEASSIPRTSEALGLPTQCFKAWSPRLTAPVFLRRVVLPVNAEPLSNEAYFLAKQICDVNNPSLVRLRDVFPTDGFSDNSLIFAYDFLPCSSTLHQLHMNDVGKISSFPHSNKKKTQVPKVSVDLLPEKTAWMYLVQLTHAIRFIHQKTNRSCGALHPSKILVQEGCSRLIINCFGLKDIINFNTSSEQASDDKLNDFVSLGKLMLCVMCGTLAVVQQSSMHIIQQAYKPDLTNLIRDLLIGKVTSVNTLVQATASYAFDQINSLYVTNDIYERQLLNELECGRLFRMICKLNSVVERADLKRPDQCTPEWSESGDRYMLKLFRDFIFHQVDQYGAPHLDLAHIINALNKVEAGSPERICLVSRDGQRVIIATFLEVRQWLDTSFAALVEEHRRSIFEQQLAQQRHRANEEELALQERAGLNGDISNAENSPTMSLPNVYI